MAIIACNHCRSRFKVPMDRLGSTIRCPKCRQDFQAVARHDVARKEYGTPPIAYAAVGVGIAVVIALVALAVNSRDPAADAGAAPGGSASAAASSATAGSAPPAGAAAAPATPADPRAALDQRARSILGALRLEDDPELPALIDFARVHNERQRKAGAGKTWEQLATDEQYASRVETLELLLGDAAQREFSKATTPVAVQVAELAGAGATVRATVRNALTEGQQDVVLRLASSAGNWQLVGIERGPVTGDAVAAAEAAKAAAKAPPVARRNPEGEVAEVAPLPDTSPSVRSAIEQHVAVLADVAATKEVKAAREALIGIGKPAIPFLLNRLVPLRLDAPEDVLVASRVAAALTEITGAEYAIVPGTNEGSLMGEGSAENASSRRRWFGWWRDNQQTFTVRPEADYGDEPEEAPKRGAKSNPAGQRSGGG